MMDGDDRTMDRGRVFPAPSFLNALKGLVADPVLKEIRYLADELVSEVYLVGGVLRNLALGVPAKPDYDIVLEKPLLERMSSSLSERLGGSFFLLDKNAPSYRVVVKGKGVKGVSETVDLSPVKEGGIVNDLMDRDFTINAMAVSIVGLFGEREPELIDPTGGYEDAGNKLLRMVSPDSFTSDPLRCVRAVRLAQRYGLFITQDTLVRMGETANLLERVSAERVRDELILIFSSPGTAEGLRSLYSTGMINAITPELAGWDDIGEGYDLLTHTLKTVEEAERIISDVFSGERAFPGYAGQLRGVFTSAICGLEPMAVLKLAAFLHDTGKAYTVGREDGRLRFIGHDHTGSLIVKEVLTRLRFSRKATNLISSLVKNHHRVFTLNKLERPTPRAKANLLRAAGAAGEGAGIILLLLSLADARATIGGEDPRLFELVLDMLSYYYGTYTRKRPEPLLSGMEVMEIFGLEEGPVIGEILVEISEGVESGVIEDKDDAIAYIKRWLDESGLVWGRGE